MKLTLVFLVSILVAISPRRQLHQQRNGQLWWSKYNNEQPRQQNIEASLYYDPVDAEIPFFRYSNPIRIRPTVIYSSQNDEELNHQFSRKQFYMEDNPADDESSEQSKNLFLFGQLFGRQHQSEDRKSGLIIPVVARPQSNNRYVTANQMTADDAMPRIKNYRPVAGDLSTGNQDPSARFFYLDGSNFLSKTVTISVTSTCTSLSIISCIPLASLDPNDPPVNCRRKRAVEIDHTDNDDVSQFQVNPTKVQTVMPTVQPLPVSPNDAIQTTPPMTSSMEEKIIDKGDSAKIIENQLRKGKFLKFNFQNFLTYTTITILKSIVTSTLTQTYLPAAALACLPAGYSICPV